MFGTLQRYRIARGSIAQKAPAKTATNEIQDEHDNVIQAFFAPAALVHD